MYIVAYSPNLDGRWSSAQVLVLSLDDNRYCGNIGRHHKSNRVMYVLYIKTGCFYQVGFKFLPKQENVLLVGNITCFTCAFAKNNHHGAQKCYDPDCKAYTSDSWPLPNNIWKVSVERAMSHDATTIEGGTKSSSSIGTPAWNDDEWWSSNLESILD